MQRVFNTGPDTKEGLGNNYSDGSYDRACRV